MREALRDLGSIPRSGRSPGEGNGNLLQFSCLENPTDRRGWQAPVHMVAKMVGLCSAILFRHNLIHMNMMIELVFSNKMNLVKDTVFPFKIKF